jgi:hypothetical protein
MLAFTTQHLALDAVGPSTPTCLWRSRHGKTWMPTFVGMTVGLAGMTVGLVGTTRSFVGATLGPIRKAYPHTP